MIERRDFLRTLSGGALLGLFPKVSLAESRLDPAAVRRGAGLDSLATFIEETPREKLLEELGARVKSGLAYKEVLGALFLAAVRTVQPRPVGFKFHAVLVINAAHLASQAGPDAERWLPLFWAIDHYKGSQAEEKTKTGWTLPAVNEARLPSADKARQAFVDALESWDPEASDAPIAALSRSATRDELYELFCLYGMRDFRDIGHKAIYVAGAFRVLDVIGWQHREPILRSLALALQYYTGDNPSRNDQPADRPWRLNQTLAKELPPDWTQGAADPAAAADLFKLARTADDPAMAKKTLDVLKARVSPESIWSALLPASGEILARRNNILSIHALTTINALRHIYRTCKEDGTKRLALLQAASFVPLFRGKLDKDVKLDELEPKAATVEEIFADVGKDNLAASRKVLGYLKDGGDPKAFVDTARTMIFLKGNNAHDYKFSSAVLEDYPALPTAWRDRFLAASVHYLRGSASPDNGLVQRIRAALK